MGLRGHLVALEWLQLQLHRWAPLWQRRRLQPHGERSMPDEQLQGTNCSRHVWAAAHHPHVERPELADPEYYCHAKPLMDCAAWVLFERADPSSARNHQRYCPGTANHRTTTNTLPACKHRCAPATHTLVHCQYDQTALCCFVGADGLDIDSSTAVTVQDSDFFAHDDGIALKSGKDWWGRHIGKSTANILIENVRSHSFVGAALAIGSETSGGIRNVTVRHFTVAGTELGLSIKTERGRGGTIEDCSFENVTIRGTGCAALQLNMQYHLGIPVGNATTTPVMRNIRFTDIDATGVVSHPGFCVPLGVIADTEAETGARVGSQSLAIFKGIDESPLRGVVLENVRLSGPSSITSGAAVQCVDATVRSVAFDVDGKPAVLACQ